MCQIIKVINHCFQSELRSISYFIYQQYQRWLYTALLDSPGQGISSIYDGAKFSPLGSILQITRNILNRAMASIDNAGRKFMHAITGSNSPTLSVPMSAITVSGLTGELRTFEKNIGVVVSDLSDEFDAAVRRNNVMLNKVDSVADRVKQIRDSALFRADEAKPNEELKMLANILARRDNNKASEIWSSFYSTAYGDALKPGNNKYWNAVRVGDGIRDPAARAELISQLHKTSDMNMFLSALKSDADGMIDFDMNRLLTRAGSSQTTGFVRYNPIVGSQTEIVNFNSYLHTTDYGSIRFRAVGENQVKQLNFALGNYMIVDGASYTDITKSNYKSILEYSNDDLMTILGDDYPSGFKGYTGADIVNDFVMGADISVWKVKFVEDFDNTLFSFLKSQQTYEQGYITRARTSNIEISMDVDFDTAMAWDTNILSLSKAYDEYRYRGLKADTTKMKIPGWTKDPDVIQPSVVKQVRVKDVVQRQLNLLCDDEIIALQKSGVLDLNLYEFWSKVAFTSNHPGGNAIGVGFITIGDEATALGTNLEMGGDYYYDLVTYYSSNFIPNINTIASNLYKLGEHSTVVLDEGSSLMRHGQQGQALIDGDILLMGHTDSLAEGKANGGALTGGSKGNEYIVSLKTYLSEEASESMKHLISGLNDIRNSKTAGYLIATYNSLEYISAGMSEFLYVGAIERLKWLKSIMDDSEALEKFINL